MDKLNITPISNKRNEAELFVKLNITHEDINEVICEIQSEDEEINTFHNKYIEEIEDVSVDFENSLAKEGIICKKQIDDKQDSNSTEIIEKTEDVFVNVEDYFVKEEDTWKQEETDDKEEYPMDNNSTAGRDNESDSDDKQDNNSTEIIDEMENVFVNLEVYLVKEKNTWKWEVVNDTEEYPTDNNSTENMDNESDSEISVNSNAQITARDSDSSEFIRKQVHATNKNDLNTAAKKAFKCPICKKCLTWHSSLARHMRSHTHEKPYVCSQCKKCFTQNSHLKRHMQVHTGEKSYLCCQCGKCFAQKSNLMRHMRVHTGEKPYVCSKCKRCFTQHSNLMSHMQVHTGMKPYKCYKCEKCFTRNSHLVSHMRVHTGEKP